MKWVKSSCLEALLENFVIRDCRQILPLILNEFKRINELFSPEIRRPLVCDDFRGMEVNQFASTQIHFNFSCVHSHLSTNYRRYISARKIYICRES